MRAEGVGAAGAAVTSAVGALANSPILLGVAVVLAIAATASYLGRRVHGGRSAAEAHGEINCGEKEEAGAAFVSR